MLSPRSRRPLRSCAAAIAALLLFAAACGCSDAGSADVSVPTDASGIEPDGASHDAAAGDAKPDGVVQDATGDAIDATAQQEAGLPGCFAAPSSGQGVALPSTLQIGSFVVSVPKDGRLGVTHLDVPSHAVFDAAEGWLRVSRRLLDVHDEQGSFSVEESVVQACDTARLEDASFDGNTLSLRGRFDDAGCGALRWTVQLCQQAPGHLGMRATTDDPSFNSIELRAVSEEAEHVYGMGEQFAHATLDLKGRRIPVLAQEGGVGRGHPVIGPAVNLASPGSAGSEESSYYAASHYLTSRNRSLFLENTEYAVFDFTQADATSIRVLAPELRARVLQGQNPLELIERFTDYAGRTPALPAWVHEGAIVALAHSPADSGPIVSALRSHGVELAAVWNQTWSGKVTTFIGEQVLWNWVVNQPGWSAMVQQLKAQGIRVMCYVNPMLVDVPPEALPVSRNLFQEARAAGYLVRDAEGNPYLLKVTAFDVGLLDLTHPQAREWMKKVIRDEMIVNAGCSGWMADFGEALPFDAVLHSGQSAASFHNEYPVEWIRLHREAVEEQGTLGETLAFNRSGHTRTPAYAMLLWEGDQLTTWDEYDGLVSAIRGLINGGLSGIALNHSDTGGYTSLSSYGLGYDREAEQLKRWTEMNAFTAVLRTHEGNQPSANAQVYSDAESMQHFARFTKVYKALGFYRKQLEQEAASRGWPMVRHLMLHYPDDEQAHLAHDQFLLGSELLVAPVKNKCWTWPWCPYDKEVYLPKGEWVHLWTGTVHGSAASGQTVTVPAPIGQPAVFYRKGSAVGAQLVANLQQMGVL